VFKLGIFYKSHGFGTSRSQVRAKVKVKATALWHWFELYECLLVLLYLHSSAVYFATKLKIIIVT